MKKVCGVGINDADYQVKIWQGKTLVWLCPFYRVWTSMLTRCYGKRKIESYTRCEVFEGWLKFSDFRAWMEKQNWDGNHLDKDLLGDGLLYSPQTCCFIPSAVNVFMTEKKRKVSDLATGVSLHKDKVSRQFSATINVGQGARQFLGYFDTEEEAASAYRQAKSALAVQIAATLEHHLGLALVNRYA